MTLLIVGASVAGIRTAQAARGCGYQGAITILSEESEHPYDKPPLSKDMLDSEGSGASVPLLTPDELHALQLDLRTDARAMSLDPDQHMVVTETGAEFHYDTLVVATGMKPRTLPGSDGRSGVFTLRDACDARALRSELPRSERIVVVGAGFIGAEFASAAVKYGSSVTLVEAQSTPMVQILGEEVGAELARLHAINGVDVLLGEQVSHFTGDPRVTGVGLTSGQVLSADTVVVGIGAEPATGWLVDSGLPVSDGVDCDENLRVPGFPDIFAAGDIARRWHPIYKTPLRIEHWTSAGEHAAIVAAGITGTAPPTPQLPYVWSDQYGKRIQIVGRPQLGHVAATRGTVDSAGFAAVYADQEGRCVGAVTIDDPRTMLLCRRAIAGGGSAEDLLLAPA